MIVFSVFLLNQIVKSLKNGEGIIEKFNYTFLFSPVLTGYQRENLTYRNKKKIYLFPFLHLGAIRRG